MYASTAPLYNRAWFDYNTRGMLLLGSLRANDAYSPYNWPEYGIFTVTALNEYLSDIWAGFFSVVTMANATIDNIETKSTANVSKEAKTTAIGEARLMRGVALFYAMHVWGPLVLFEHNQEVVDNPVRPRNPEEDVFRFIINDLTYAAENLPDKPFADGRATCWSAKAMLAKVYLARSGWDKTQRDEADLAQAKKYALDVIENSGAKLLDDYHNLFKYRYNNNEESLLACQWYKSTTMQWYVCNCTISDICADSKMLGGVMCWSALNASPDMLMQYRYKGANGAYKWEVTRRDASFCTHGVYYDYICKADGGYTYEGTAAPIKKGVVGGPDDDNDGYVAMMCSPLNTYIIRLADVYLIKAEAILGNQESTSDAEGLAAINAIRQRAKVKNLLTSYTFEDIIKERRKEFCMEFSNWYDMVTWYRWKPQYMLKYFNNRQHRAWMINQGDVLYNSDRTISYRAFPNRQSSAWYFYDDTRSPRGCYWNDCMREDDSETVIQTKEEGYVYDMDKLASERDGYDPVTLNETNIFLPYPESDVIRNPYFGKDAENYDFGE
jgi:hypothetical protein